MSLSFKKSAVSSTWKSSRMALQVQVLIATMSSFVSRRTKWENSQNLWLFYLYIYILVTFFSLFIRKNL